MKWVYALIGIVSLALICSGTRVFGYVKLTTDSFPVITDPMVNLTLNRTGLKRYIFSKTIITYSYMLIHTYDSSATEFNVQQLIIDIPEDTTFYYKYKGRGYLYGGADITEYAKFCDIPHNDLVETADAEVIVVYMHGGGYTLSVDGKVMGLKEWLEGKGKNK